MALTDFVIMPGSDYQAICDAVRTKTGSTDTLKSGDIPTQIEGISGGGTEMEDDLADRSLSGAYTNDRITKIGQYAFRGCTKVTSMSFPKVKSVASNGMYGCTKLTSVDLPVVTSIAGDALNNCSNLSSVNIPLIESLTSYSFRSCVALAFIDLHEIGSIAANAFYGCSTLATIVLRKKDAICTLEATSALGNTCFASGKSGGKVYVPEALIESYKTGTNWSTLYAAGTCEFVAIEGSEYDTSGSGGGTPAPH